MPSTISQNKYLIFEWFGRQNLKYGPLNWEANHWAAKLTTWSAEFQNPDLNFPKNPNRPTYRNAGLVGNITVLKISPHSTMLCLHVNKNSLEHL